MKIKELLLDNFALKSLAFLLAFVTWLYVGEATKVEPGKTILQKLLSPSPYISKKLYIKPIFVGDIPQDYEFLQNDVKVTPPSMVVLGPSGILEKKEFIYTMPIDLSEHTKGKSVEVDLKNISRSIRFEKTKVQVFLPIKKKASESPEE